MALRDASASKIKSQKIRCFENSILAMEPKIQAERTTLRGTFEWPLWPKSATIKRVIFSLRTGPIHNFFTYARHDEPGGPVINSDIIKSTPKIRH